MFLEFLPLVCVFCDRLLLIDVLCVAREWHFCGSVLDAAIVSSITTPVASLPLPASAGLTCGQSIDHDAVEGARG